MTAKQRLGDVAMADYLKMVAKPGSWRRTRALVWAGSCIAAFAAGGFGPWPGKYTHQLSFAEAVALIDQAPVAEWQHETGVRAMMEHLVVATDRLAKVATAQDPAAGLASKYSVLALRHSAVAALVALRQVQASGAHPSDVAKALELAQQALEGR